MMSFGYFMSVCLSKSCSLDFSNFFRTICTWCDKLETRVAYDQSDKVLWIAYFFPLFNPQGHKKT